MRNIDSDLIRGNIDTIILKTMLDGDKYGLDIIKEVELRSNGTYELKQPTLYSCLKRLENQELISSYWLDSDIGGRRHYYKLTDKGREEYEKKQEEWSKSKFIIDNLLSNYNYDDYRLVKKDDYDRIIEGKTFNYENVAEKSDSAISSDNQNLEDSNDEDFDNSTEIENEEETFADSGMEISEMNNEESPTFDEDEESDDMSDYENLESSLHQEEFNFGGSQEEDETDDERVYISNNEGQSQSDVYDNSNSYEEDEEEIERRLNSENNILASLRKQDDEEVYTYVGDQKSYINHLNLGELKQMQDEADENDYNIVQQNLLDNPNLNSDNELDDKIDEFSQNIDELNKFLASKNSEISNSQENKLESEETENDDTHEVNIENESENDNENTNEFVAQSLNEDSHEDDEPLEDNFLEELNELNGSRNGYFSSNDSAEYEKYEFPSSEQEYETQEDEELSDFKQEEITTENENNIEENFPTIYSDDEESEETQEEVQETSTFADYSHFDDIISKNVNDYTDTVQSTMFTDNDFSTFTPKYTSENYKEKLSNLSQYSKTSIEETEKPETNKNSKSMQSLKNEFEKEGIEVKEFTKYYKSDEAEKSYLLINKINLINSLILLFGFVFLLSAVYVILNNTSYSNLFELDFRYFLIGLIPFVIYTFIYAILYLINPYRKVPAKYAPRIMLLISTIITVQLLLITYCVNLQLGFYSFTQANYNHLLWIIPTIISFAPIVCNLIYMALFYSKNFNV